MTAKRAPQTQQEYLHDIWERLGRVEGVMEAQETAREAACAKQLKLCGDRFGRIESELHEHAAGNGAAVVSVKDVRSFGRWLAPWIGKGVALVALLLGLWLVGKGQIAAEVAQQVLEDVTAKQLESPKK